MTVYERYFDRDGEPLTLPQLAYLLEQRDYAVVRQTTLRSGKLVSTVWLGLDHSFGGGPPLVFESRVFASPVGGDTFESDRYSTEVEAIAGHEALVQRWGREPRRKKLSVKRQIARAREDWRKARRRMRCMVSIWWQSPLASAPWWRDEARKGPDAA